MCVCVCVCVCFNTLSTYNLFIYLYICTYINNNIYRFIYIHKCLCIKI